MGAPFVAGRASRGNSAESSASRSRVEPGSSSARRRSIPRRTWVRAVFTGRREARGDLARRQVVEVTQHDRLAVRRVEPLDGREQALQDLDARARLERARLGLEAGGVVLALVAPTRGARAVVRQAAHGAGEPAA